MDRTYLFYDIETSGLNKCFDQVFQFAAIRTDLELNEISRHEFKIRLLPDVIPAPAALLTHNISIPDLQQGMLEVEAIQKIHQLMNTPGTISLGYNTLGFDDEFLRFSFYRNLLPPYTHQYANQCSRLDLYPIILMFYLYKNDVIKWPMLNGKVSLKLEQLKECNQLTVGAAHDAMVDVEATLALAKIIYKEQEMWQYLHGFFDKNTNAQRFAKLPAAITVDQQIFREGILIDGGLGYDQLYQCPVLALGAHNHYKNQTLWLRLDSEHLTKTTADNLTENTWVFRQKSGEANFILPPLPRYTSQLNQQRQNLANENKKWLENNKNILLEIVRYHKNYKYPAIPNIDVDAALYQLDFLTDHEQKLCDKFHAAKIENKINVISEMRNPNLSSKAIRVMGRNYPQLLSNEYRDEFSHYLKNINPANDSDALIDYKNNKRMTPIAALKEIKEIKVTRNLNENQLQLLNDLKNYLLKTFNVKCDHEIKLSE